MSNPLIPYTFQDRTGSLNLRELDANFQALAAATTGGPASIFDGGAPTTSFSAGAHLDAGTVA